MPVHIFRVVVRGHFHGLDEEQRDEPPGRGAEPRDLQVVLHPRRHAHLRAEPRRVQLPLRAARRGRLGRGVRGSGARARAREDAGRRSPTMEVDYRHLRANAVNMADVWS